MPPTKNQSAQRPYRTSILDEYDDLEPGLLAGSEVRAALLDDDVDEVPAHRRTIDTGVSRAPRHPWWWFILNAAL